MNAQKRLAIELAHRFKRRYDTQLLQAKIDYMTSLHAPCVLAIIGDEVYAYNSKSDAFMAHKFKARYIGVYNRTWREWLDSRYLMPLVSYEIRVANVYGFCYHYNENLCKCKHTGAKGEYWIATPLADGTIDIVKVK